MTDFTDAARLTDRQLWSLHCDFFEHVISLRYPTSVNIIRARVAMRRYREIIFRSGCYGVSLDEIIRVADWARRVADESNDPKRTYETELNWQLTKIKEMIGE